MLTVGTVLVPHGTITDSSLLALYTAYNLWTIARRSPTIALHPDQTSLLRFVSHVTWSAIPADSVYGLIATVVGMFSVEIITTLLLQMAIFITATNMYVQAAQRDGAGGDPPAAEWLVRVFWPCMGRSVLVAIYSYAWLVNTSPSGTVLLLDPLFWRWANIFASLALYTYHLLTPTDGSQSLNRPHEHYD